VPGEVWKKILKRKEMEFKVGNMKAWCFKQVWRRKEIDGI